MVDRKNWKTHSPHGKGVRMIVIKTIIEGLGLGLLLYIVCAIGIRNGAVGMVHLYSEDVQNRVVELGLTTAENIKKGSKLFKGLCIPAMSYMYWSAFIASTAQGDSYPASGRCWSFCRS